ncbi:MAG: RsmE family RNA methyltransferase [Rhodothermales bacterium]|nr:RsmE family RNA methyltransferase [Rhodothermales bacterium]
MTTYFYTPPDRVHGDRLTLPPDEALHAFRVVRRRTGDEIVVVDGAGGWYRVVIDGIDAHQVAGRIVERREEVGEPAFRLRVGMALLKQEKRFSHFLEKATELGVSEVIPLVTARTEKQSIRPARVEHVLQAAMKQCLRSRVVSTAEPRSLVECLSGVGAELLLVCHEASDAASDALLDVIARAGTPPALTVLVGPEGGFTDDEVARLTAAGARAVSLGERRLRAETAAIAVCAGIMLHYQRHIPSTP